MSAARSVQKITIEVDPSTLAISTSGSITGVIAIRTSDIVFPEAGWSDFPVVILSWWLEPVAQILAGNSKVWDCRFMDGPYSLRLEKEQNDIWMLRGLYDRRTVEFTATVSLAAFLNRLLSVAQKVLRESRKRGWQNTDIKNLGSAIQNAQRSNA